MHPRKGPELSESASVGTDPRHIASVWWWVASAILLNYGVYGFSAGAPDRGGCDSERTRSNHVTLWLAVRLAPLGRRWRSHHVPTRGDSFQRLVRHQGHLARMELSRRSRLDPHWRRRDPPIHRHRLSKGSPAGTKRPFEYSRTWPGSSLRPGDSPGPCARTLSFPGRHQTAP